MDKDKINCKRNSNADPCTGYQMHKDSKKEETSTDVYYKTEKRIPHSKVAMPTLDAVIESKEWVDNENKK